MSKSLTYKEAETILQAVAMSGAEIPTLKWIMGKREPWNWHGVITAADELVTKGEMFKWYLSEDTDEQERYTT